jgi:hypothetical protein
MASGLPKLRKCLPPSVRISAPSALISSANLAPRVLVNHSFPRLQRLRS